MIKKIDLAFDIIKEKLKTRGKPIEEDELKSILLIELDVSLQTLQIYLKELELEKKIVRNWGFIDLDKGLTEEEVDKILRGYMKEKTDKEVDDNAIKSIER